MDKIAVYIHGKDGNVNEAEHYKPLFPQYDVKGFDYKAQTPWEAKKEFPSAIRSLCKEYESVTLIANSIGAYFALHSLAGQRIEKAFLISPIVDMEELIIQMMAQAGITEGELEKRKEKREKRSIHPVGKKYRGSTCVMSERILLPGIFLPKCCMGRATI